MCGDASVSWSRPSPSSSARTVRLLDKLRQVLISQVLFGTG